MCIYTYIYTYSRACEEKSKTENPIKGAWDVELENKDFVCDIIASQLKLLIYERHLKTCMSPRLDTMLRLVTEPSSARAAIVKCDIKKGTLELSPVTPSISCAHDKKACAGLVDLGVGAVIDSKEFRMYAAPCIKHAEDKRGVDNATCDMKLQEEFYVPFWFVGTTYKPQEANMKFEVVPSTKKADKSADGWHCGEYFITVLVNSVDLKEGDTLKYYTSSIRERYPNQDTLKKRKTD